MKKELVKKLVESYPTLYSEYGERHFRYIGCGDGWFDLINRLSEKLEPFGVVALQIKEKFGGLRFYIGAAPSEHFEEIYRYIHEAESKSFEICEDCGAPGFRRERSWIKTLCDRCNLSGELK